jgi:hypothetical protein
MSPVATLVERAPRFVVLVALPDGHKADLVADALAAKIATLPAAVTRTLTWDQGNEMAEHLRFTQATGVEVYFCDPKSPWQRGSNENTNGLLRQYLPRTLDFRTLTQADLDAIADQLNGRPRQTLGFKTPSQALGIASCVVPTIGAETRAGNGCAVSRGSIGGTARASGRRIDRFRSAELDRFETDHVVFQYSRAAKGCGGFATRGRLVHRGDDRHGRADRRAGTGSTATQMTPTPGLLSTDQRRTKMARDDRDGAGRFTSCQPDRPAPELFAQVRT